MFLLYDETQKEVLPEEYAPEAIRRCSISQGFNLVKKEEPPVSKG